MGVQVHKFIETGLRLDSDDHLSRVLDFFRNKNIKPQEKQLGIHQLIKLRSRSAFALAETLSDLGYSVSLISILLSLDSTIYCHKNDEENRLLKELNVQIDRLDHEERTRLYQQILAPSMSHLLVVSLENSHYNQTRTILDILARAVPQNSLLFEWNTPILSAFLTANTNLAATLIEILESLALHDDIISIYHCVITMIPDNLKVLLAYTRALTAKGKIEEALQHTHNMKNSGHDIPEQDFQPLISLAVNKQNSYVELNQLDNAINILKLTKTLLPQHDFSQTLTHLEFFKHKGMITQYKKNKDVHNELNCRLQIFYNAFDVLQLPSERLDNIYYALSCLLLLPQDSFIEREPEKGQKISEMKLTALDDQKISLIKDLVNAVSTIPSNITAESYQTHDDQVLFERFYRLLISAIDCDVVFGPPLEPLATPSIPLYSATGVPLATSHIQRLIDKLEPEVLFFSSASEEYSLKYSQTYIQSIIKNCDCRFLIIICISSERDCIAEITHKIGIDDERVIFFTDHYSKEQSECNTYVSTSIEPFAPGGVYFASLVLIYLGDMIQLFNLPIIFTGMDTVLKKGAHELINSFKGYDVIINKLKDEPSIASQLVNNLSLIYPTANSMLFAAFLNRYLPVKLQQKSRAGYIDQMIIHLALHHVAYNSNSHKFGYFDGYDINNFMFSSENSEENRFLIRKFRFINLYCEGVKGRDIDPETMLNHY